MVCLILTACNGTRHLPKGEKLYTGAEIKLDSPVKVNKRLIKTKVEEAVRPLPNAAIFGIRPKLWLYNIAGAEPHTKFKKWLKRTGQAPVLMSSVKPGVTSAIIDARLFNMGIFDSFTESKTVETEHTAKIIYTSHLHKPYIVKDLTYDISDDSISHMIVSDKDKPLVKVGQDYNLDILKTERTRIDAILKNKGYFYFNPDYLLFKADTSHINQTVSLRLTLKDSIPQNALTAYRINNVYINQNYSLNERRYRNAQDTVMVENLIFLGKLERMPIRPKVLSRSIYLRKHEVFSRQNHIITLNRLMSMGNFKLVQINFSVSNDSGPGLLDVNILMTPMPKHTFRAELDLVSKSNNFMGPRMNVSVLNRNTFNGAELLNLNMAGSFEAQLGGVKNLYSYSYSPQVELTIPRFLVPFKLKRTSSMYIPKTTLQLSYNYMNRVGYFDMHTFRFIYGYKWKETIRKEHELNPIDVSFTTVGNKSDDFNKLLEANPFLKKSYEEQFIAGGSYSFTYNEQMLTGKKLQSYFRLSTEIAGNAFSLAKSIGGEKISSDNPSKVVGSVYSQFTKLSVDGRTYYNFKSHNKLAMRVFAGLAKPFGNSSVLPYTKQFFSGGPNSIRAFQINSVGPGTYHQDTRKVGFLQLGGDVKLETNVEYRFTIYNFFKGALFVDAGNVWLLKSNPALSQTTTTTIPVTPAETPLPMGSPFMLSQFMNQFAVGAGVGLRVDVSFFILRFDLAMPLRKPWLEGNKWVTDQINFGSSIWRRDNLVLNVAIGYPF
jgi:hypothetical protein